MPDKHISTVDDYRQIINEYRSSVDEDVRSFVQDVLADKDQMNYITVAFLTDEAAKTIERLTGKNVLGNRVVLDINAVKHIENRHGKEGKQDHSMKDVEDLARIGYVITHFDTIEYDGKTTTGYLAEDGSPAPVIRIGKRIDGTYYAVQAVNSSKKKKCYIVSAYISQTKKQPSDP